MTVSPYDQRLFDLFATACEGGINYFAGFDEYHWQDEATGDEDVYGFYATIFIDASDEPPFLPDVNVTKGTATSWSGSQYDTVVVTVDRAVMARGYELACTRSEKTNHHQWQCGTGRPFLDVSEDDDWDFDALDAGAVLQLGLFGVVIYG